jgi:hypothetical protein
MGMVGTTLMPKAASMYDTDACALIVIRARMFSLSSQDVNNTKPSAPILLTCNQQTNIKPSIETLVYMITKT